MIDWYEFLDKRFSLKKEAIKTRDRVVTVCSKCENTSIVQVCNLKKQIKRKGTHLCWSCSAKQGRENGSSKYKQTMLQKYGVENPSQNKEIQKKIQRTNKKRYGEEGSIGLARKKLKEIKKPLQEGLLNEECKDLIKQIDEYQKE